MGIDDFEGFKATEVDALPTHEEENGQFLAGVKAEYPSSVLVKKLEELSGEDLAILDYACNSLGTDFLAFGVFEAYEEPEDVSELENALQVFSQSTPEKKKVLAKSIIQKIAE